MERSYFAASNGYTGFRNYFNNVFNSPTFEHIFVLKGGPGTGKSTIMKKLASKAAEQNLSIDKIFCSSDPNSLDGVIIYSKKGKYAVIDGTAPHERDSVFPGAADSIINLGDNFDIKKLKRSREEILTVNKRKKSAYTSAYETLRCAGAINERIKRIVYDSFSHKKAQLLSEKLCSLKKSSHFQNQIMITNAFCKFGRYELNTYNDFQRTYKIYGDYGSNLLFLNISLQNSKQNYDYISYDPLDKDACDAVAIGDTAFVCSHTKEDAFLDTSELLELRENEDELKHLTLSLNSLLEIARGHFSIAADFHFKLEEIYSEAVFFEKNDELYHNISENIF